MTNGFDVGYIVETGCLPSLHDVFFKHLDFVSNKFETPLGRPLGGPLGGHFILFFKFFLSFRQRFRCLTGLRGNDSYIPAIL